MESQLANKADAGALATINLRGDSGKVQKKLKEMMYQLRS